MAWPLLPCSCIEEWHHTPKGNTVCSAHSLPGDSAQYSAERFLRKDLHVQEEAALFRHKSSRPPNHRQDTQVLEILAASNLDAVTFLIFAQAFKVSA